MSFFTEHDKRVAVEVVAMGSWLAFWLFGLASCGALGGGAGFTAAIFITAGCLVGNAMTLDLIQDLFDDRRLR